MLQNSSIVAAPLDAETNIIRVEFAILQNTSQQALESEKWRSTPEQRANTLSQVESLTTDEQPAQSSGDLTSNLKKITSSGQYSILYSSVWTQPQSKKRLTHAIQTSISNSSEYNLGFGSLRLQERSALVATLKFTMVDTWSLQPEAIAENQNLEQSLNQPINEVDTTLFDDLLPEEQSTPIATQVALAPVLTLDQQRQVTLNKIHYFDHPITPAFLLVTRLKKSTQRD